MVSPTIARSLPVLFLSVAAACASRGTTTNVTSAGAVATDTARAAVAPVDTAARDTMARDTTARRDTAVVRDTAVTTPPAAPPTTEIQLRVSEAAGVGSYLTDANGRAVYILVGPDSAAITCTDACAAEFDPVVGRAVVVTGDTVVQAAMIGSVALPNGTQQVTYGGKPLFYARADQTAGDTKGQGTKSYGTARLVNPRQR